MHREDLTLDLVLFHVCAPVVLYHLDLHTFCLRFVRLWFATVATILGNRNLPPPPRPPGS